MGKFSKNIHSHLHFEKGFVAHRGLQSVAPENTIEAIHAAGREGFVMCEIDPAITLDGVWITCHDKTITRTTNGTGLVAEMSLAQIQRYKINPPSHQINMDKIIKIPLFEDVLKACTSWGMGVNIDGGKFMWDQVKVKYLLTMLQKYNLEKNSMVSLPNVIDRPVFKQNAPELPVCIVSTPENSDETILELQEYQYPIIAFQSSQLTDEIIAKCKNANIPIYVWAANTNKTAYQWIDKGISFVETDCILPKDIL